MLQRWLVSTLVVPMCWLFASAAWAEEFGVFPDLALSDYTHRTVFDLRARIWEQCGKASGSTDYPVERQVGSPGEPTMIRMDYAVTKWSGGCSNGKRDGFGQLVTLEKDVDNANPKMFFYQSKTRLEVTRTGSFVQGKPEGLWCLDNYDYDLSIKKRGCRLNSGDKQSDPYLKLPDGRWQLLVTDELKLAVPETILAAGTLERESERILAAIAASGTPPAIKEFKAVESSVLDDLVAGSKFTDADKPGTIPFTGKRVALILSSPTIAALAKFTADRQAFIAASAGVTGESARLREIFIRDSDPKTLLLSVAAGLRSKAAVVDAVDDLSGLAAKRYDYAVVVDWRPTIRLDLLGKYKDLPYVRTLDSNTRETIADETLSALVINQNMEVVKKLAVISMPQTTSIEYKRCYKRIVESCDEIYMRQLALFFEQNWPASPPGKIVEYWMVSLQ